MNIQNQLPRLGRLDFINVLPVYYAIDHGLLQVPCNIINGRTPVHLNDMMAEKKLDISVISSAEYIRNNNIYTLLPGLSIASKGPVMSVLCHSRFPLEELGNKEVLLTDQSATSQFLMRLVLKKRFNCQCRFTKGKVTPETVRTKKPDAFLLIGDPALYYKKFEDYPYVTDLAELWREWSGLPFVFAVWAVRNESLDIFGDTIVAINRLLCQSRKIGMDNLEIIAKEAAGKVNISQKRCLDYLNGLTFDLNKECRAGLRLYSDYLAEEGLLQEAEGLNLSFITRDN